MKHFHPTLQVATLFRVMPKAVATLLAMICFLFAYHTWVIWHFDGETPGASADAAVVLGASVNATLPSPVYQARIRHAVDLYHAGSVKKIILTGGLSPGNSLSDAEIALNYVLAQGVGVEDAYAETESTKTRENLQFTLTLAKNQGLKTFLIVSDPLHLKRAMAMAKNIGMDAKPSATPHTLYIGWVVKIKFAVRETYYYWGQLLSNL